ncbi:MAG: NTP transferase domain-containing protein, partial [Candidatus Limnocylindrales bacterium]
GRDKLAEPMDGRRLLDRAVEAVRAVASEVVIVAAPGAELRAPKGVLVAYDPRPFEGPLAGLAAGLAALPPDVDRVLVVGADMPTLVVPVLERLVRGLEAREGVVLADDVRPRPLPLAVRSSPASAAADRLLAGGERRLRALLSELDVDVIPATTWRVDDPDGSTLRDIDLPTDLQG